MSKHTGESKAWIHSSTYQGHVNVAPNEGLSFTEGKRVILIVQSGGLTGKIIFSEFGGHGDGKKDENR